MKRLVKGVVVLVLLASFFTLAGGTLAHAATRSARKVNSCPNYQYHYKNIYATKGHVGDYLGYIEIGVNGCGGAEATAYPTSGTYVNHLWVEYAPGAIRSSDFGGGTGSRGTGWWLTTPAACAGGVFQNGSDWGGGDTACYSTN